MISSHHVNTLNHSHLPRSDIVHWTVYTNLYKFHQTLLWVLIKIFHYLINRKYYLKVWESIGVQSLRSIYWVVCVMIYSSTLQVQVLNFRTRNIWSFKKVILMSSTNIQFLIYLSVYWMEYRQSLALTQNIGCRKVAWS